MKSTKKLISTAIALAIGLCTLTNLSAMESPEQRAEEARLYHPPLILPALRSLGEGGSTPKGCIEG